MNFNVQTVGLKRVERDIAPPMRMAITIPVTAESDTRKTDVTIYVCVSAFGPLGRDATSSWELEAIAKEVARRLKAASD